MPDTLKKLREPAALAAVVFAGLVLLVAVINLLAPPSPGGFSPSFSDSAFNQVTAFLDVEVAAAVAFAVYLANYVAPALPKARLITLAALIEAGVAVVFGVVTALALFGSNADGESKFLKFLQAAGGAAVVAVAALFVWLSWQLINGQSRPAGQSPAGPFGGQQGWPGAGTQGPGGQGPGGQQYSQPTPPPGGFGWTPQQQPGGPGTPGQQGGAAGPTAFGQQQAQGGYGAAQQPQPGPPQPPSPPQPFGGDRTQLLPPVQAGQPGPGGQPGQGSQQPGQSGPVGYGNQPGAQPFGQTSGGASGTQPFQQQAPPTMQGYAAQPSPWSPGGPGSAQNPPTAQPPEQQGQQVPPQQARAEDPERSGGPFQIGDWQSE